jgi:predicted DNA-binding transcriptional regulator AlpA
MTDRNSQYMRRDEVEKLHPVHDRTRRRAEAAGLFPTRIKLAPNISVWLRDEVTGWQANPRGWAQRDRGASAA